MEIDENLLETKKFKMYAETAETPERRIELCKKYLKSKGIDYEAMEQKVRNAEMEAYEAKDQLFQEQAYKSPPIWSPPPSSRFREEIVVHAQEMIDHWQLRGISATEKRELIDQVHRSIAKHMTHELLANGVIKIEEMKDMVCDRTIFVGKLKVLKESK